MKKTRKTRKPFKSNPKIVPNMEYAAGRLICQVPSWVRPRVDSFPVPAKVSRDAMVTFACAHCDGVGLTQFRHLKDGTAKSCGCLETKAFNDCYDRRLASIHPRKRKSIFSDAYFLGQYAAATIHSIDKYMIGWVKRATWARMGSISVEKQDQIHATAQLSTETACKEFKYSRAEVLVICKLANERHSAQLSEDNTIWNALSEEDQKNALAVNQGCKLAMIDANNRIFIKSKLSNGEYREFNQFEFSINRDSMFGWLLETVDLLPPAIARKIFGKDLEQFRRNISWTLWNRSQWEKKYKADAKLGIKHPTRPKAKRPVYEIPKINPAAIASHLINSVSYPSISAAA